MSKALYAAIAASYATLAEHFQLMADAEDGGSDKPAVNRPMAKKAPAPQSATGGAASGKKLAAPGKSKARAQVEPEADFDTLKAKLMQVVKEQSKDNGVACLQRFGVEKLSELSAEQYDEFGAFMDQVIAGEVDPNADVSDGGDDDLLG